MCVLLATYNLSLAPQYGNKVVALFGSTPSYATGVIDPIAEIAAIAREAGVGMHVDACLGGFIVDNLDHVDGNFLAIPGVTSLSADTHKNGASQCVRALPLPCLC